MSVAAPDVRGKPLPRWSVLNPTGLLPALIAGLPGSSACVRDRPPLSVSGPSSGSVPITLPLPRMWNVQFVGGHNVRISELDALIANEPMVGRDGHRIEALPHAALK